MFGRKGERAVHAWSSQVGSETSSIWGYAARRTQHTERAGVSQKLVGSTMRKTAAVQVIPPLGKPPPRERPRRKARWILEVAAGWAGPLSRGPWGGDALPLRTRRLRTTVRSERNLETTVSRSDIRLI
jgi:hypothetical protein